MKTKEVKNVRVRVEDIETGEIVKDFDCGVDLVRAEKLENSLLDRTNLEKFHVYQSVTI